MLFLSVPFMSSLSAPSRSSTLSFSKGVDSPESMASLTMAVPRMRRRSQGMPESGLVRTASSASARKVETQKLSDYVPIDTISPGTSSDEITSTHLPSRYVCTLYGVIDMVRNSVNVRTRYQIS